MFLICSFVPSETDLNRAAFLMMTLESFCLKELDELAGGGSSENMAALGFIARLCPPGRPGIWYMPDVPVTAESLAGSGALVVPNQAALDEDGTNFVPNRTNEWGDPIFALNPTVPVGLSRLIPVYAMSSHLCQTG